MSKTVLFSSIDAALWFSEQATTDEVHLQPERLHRLLFLAQWVFAERFDGARLMPANFVVYNNMPIEVNVFRAFEGGHPILGAARVEIKVLQFLDEIWQYHGHSSLERIGKALQGNAVYARLTACEDGREISFAEMREIAAVEIETHAVAEEMKKSHPLNSSAEILPDGRVVETWSPRVVSRKSVYKIETIKRR